MSNPEDMWQCQTNNCGYTYDPERGDRKGKIPKGVKFQDLPDSWKCPVCGGSKKCFRSLTGVDFEQGEECELPVGNP